MTKLRKLIVSVLNDGQQSHVKPSSTATGTAVATLSNRRPYPPNDGLIEVVPIEAVINHSAEEIDLLIQAVGITVNKAPQLLVEPIRRMCEMTLMLPATRDGFYRGPGGLFRMSIDTALFAARVAHQTEFSGLGAIEKRRKEGSRWRLACTLAGLTVDLHRVRTAYTVTSANGKEWSPLTSSLTEFVEGETEVQLVWHPEDDSRRARAHNLSLLMRVLGAHVLQELHDGGSEIVDQLFAYLADDPSSNAAPNHIRPVVDSVRAKLIAKDLATDPMRFGKRQTGIALGPYLADAMRSLLHDGKWTVNDQKGRVWLASDGVFIIWPVAAKELTAWLAETDIKGIPRDEHTIVQLMNEAGIVCPFDPPTNDIAALLWPITLPGGREVNALKLSSPSILWPIGDGPDPVSIGVRNVRRQASASSPTPDPAPMQPDSAVATKRTGTAVPASTDQPDTKAAPEPNKKRGTAYPSPELLQAIAKLPRPLQVCINDLVREFKSPSHAQRIAHIRPDGRVELFADFISGYGVESDILANLFRQAGWVEANGKLFNASQKASSRAVMLLNAEYSALVLPGDVGALFATEPPETKPPLAA